VSWPVGALLSCCLAFASGCSCEGSPGAARDLAPAADLADTGPGADLAARDSGGNVDGAARLGASDTVSGGDRSRSPSYIMIHTLGQPTQNQDKTVSPHYRMQGGLSGASGR
jgi:hypothetical protein